MGCEQRELADIITPERKALSGRGLVVWQNHNVNLNNLVLYVPGLAGDTMLDFGTAIQPWLQENDGNQAWGILHSGIIDNPQNSALTAATKGEDELVNAEEESRSKKGLIKNVGVVPNDWIEDIKRVIESASKSGRETKIVAHSFGGLFAVLALAELISEKRLPQYQSDNKPPILLVTVSAPHYLLSSLPDETPLLGTYSADGFTYYHNQDGSRIPMASVDAWTSIWSYLSSSKTIKVNRDESYFTQQLLKCFGDLEETAPVLAKTDIRMVSLHPYADRWVSRKSGTDLQKIIGRQILIDSFAIPMAANTSLVGKNTHDMVREWWPVVQKYL